MNKSIYYIFYLLIFTAFNKVSSHKILDVDDYSFKAVYHTKSAGIVVSLIKNVYGNIKKMIIDDEEVEPCISYSFRTPGTHVVYVLIDLSSQTTLYQMFYEVSLMDSIEFTSNFNTEKITNFDYMFYMCSSLTSIDISKFNTKSLTTMSRMFFNCRSLISVDLSNFETPKLKIIEGLFINAHSLKDINFWIQF